MSGEPVLKRKLSESPCEDNAEKKHKKGGEDAEFNEAEAMRKLGQEAIKIITLAAKEVEALKSNHSASVFAEAMYIAINEAIEHSQVCKSVEMYVSSYYSVPLYFKRAVIGKTGCSLAILVAGDPILLVDVKSKKAGLKDVDLDGVLACREAVQILRDQRNQSRYGLSCATFNFFSGFSSSIQTDADGNMI
jgi:hypothetical protein